MDKKKLTRIILTAVLLVIAVAIEKTMGLEVWQLLLVYLVPFLLIGYDVIGEAIEGIREGEVFDEDFLMCIATIGAMLIGFLPGAETEFPEAVFVMLFFQLGELFEHYAEDNSRKSISHLMEIRPDTANVVRNGKTQVVDPGKVAVREDPSRRQDNRGRDKPQHHGSHRREHAEERWSGRKDMLRLRQPVGRDKDDS